MLPVWKFKGPGRRIYRGLHPPPVAELDEDVIVPPEVAAELKRNTEKKSSSPSAGKLTNGKTDYYNRPCHNFTEPCLAKGDSDV